jgi:hypothetical protein
MSVFLHNIVHIELITCAVLSSSLSAGEIRRFSSFTSSSVLGTSPFTSAAMDIAFSGQKKKKKKNAARGIPRWSPTPVLTTPHPFAYPLIFEVMGREKDGCFLNTIINLLLIEVLVVKSSGMEGEY